MAKNEANLRHVRIQSEGLSYVRIVCIVQNEFEQDTRRLFLLVFFLRI